MGSKFENQQLVRAYLTSEHQVLAFSTLNATQNLTVTYWLFLRIGSRKTIAFLAFDNFADLAKAIALFTVVVSDKQPDETRHNSFFEEWLPAPPRKSTSW